MPASQKDGTKPVTVRLLIPTPEDQDDIEDEEQEEDRQQQHVQSAEAGGEGHLGKQQGREQGREQQQQQQGAGGFNTVEIQCVVGNGPGGNPALQVGSLDIMTPYRNP